MVGTLIKHEVLRTRRWLGIVFALAALVTGMGALLAWTEWPLLSQLGVTMAFVGVGAFLTVVQVGLAYDYWRSSYSKTGYFTQSLPVKGSTIFWSKLAWGCLVTLVSILVNLVLVLVAYLGMASTLGIAQPVEGLRGLWAELGGLFSPLVWFAMTVAAVLMVLGTLVQYYFAASFGSEARLNRFGLGGPVLVWFGLYMVMQVLLFIGIFAVPLGLGIDSTGGVSVETMNFFTLMVNDQEPQVMPLGMMPVILVATVLLLWRTVISWNKKVSLA